MSERAQEMVPCRLLAEHTCPSGSERKQAAVGVALATRNWRTAQRHARSAWPVMLLAWLLIGQRLFLLMGWA